MVIGAVGAESALCLRLCTRGAALAVGLAAWLTRAVGQGKAEGPQSGAEFRECSGCQAMIVIPAGRCSMGSSKDDADARANERQPDEVRIAGPIAVAKFEATFDEWDACAAAGACPRVPDGWRRGQIPVINVSWNDAKQYPRLALAGHGQAVPASDRGGNEYALRAGSVTRYPWGESPGGGEANCVGCESRWDLGQTAPVGSFQPNAFGLYALRTGRDGFKATQTAGSSAAVLAQRYFGRSRRHPG